jgi:hypothetical protein
MFFCRAKQVRSKSTTQVSTDEITASLKALSTLSCVDGRVSVSVSEVVDRPGYLEQRRAAAALVRRAVPLSDVAWESMTDDALVVLISQSVVRSRACGLGFDQTVCALRMELDQISKRLVL